MHPLHPIGPGHEGRLSTSAISVAARPPAPGEFAPFVRLLRYARPYVGVIAVALTLASVYSGALALRAYLVKPMMDEVLLKQHALNSLPAGSFIAKRAGVPSQAATPDPAAEAKARVDLQRTIEANFWKWTLAALVIGLALPFTAFGKDYLVEYTMGLVRVDLQQAVCAKLLALPLSYHRGTTRGDALSRTMNDVSRAHGALSLLFGDVVQAALRLIAGASILFWISWQVAFLALSVAPLTALVVGIFGRRIRKTAKRRQEKISDVVQRLVEILSGIKVIKAFRGEAVEAQAFARENRTLFRREMKVVQNRVASRSLVEMLSHLSMVAMLLPVTTPPASISRKPVSRYPTRVTPPTSHRDPAPVTVTWLF